MFLFLFPVVPKNNGHNNVLGTNLDIELGNTEEELKDDPGTVHSLLFLYTLCIHALVVWPAVSV